MSLESQVGLGGAFQYTDNAKLAASDAVEDVVATTYIGASISENEGPLEYGADATVRRENYLNDTFADRSYINFGVDAKWEMIKKQFDWFLVDRFGQRPIVSTAADTPNNYQDSNLFNFGANIKLFGSGRHTISLIPEFSQYNYEALSTDNRQYSLTANWRYRVTRLMNIGLIAKGRKIDYNDESLINTTFTSVGLNLTGNPVRSSYAIILGATNVKRDNGQSDTGFAGSVKLQKELSSRSTITALVATNLTDTSKASRFDAPGNPDDVQITTDVIRNRVGSLTYTRKDALLRTSLLVQYRDIVYSDTESSNQTTNTFGANLNFPITQLISGGVFLKFNNIDLPNAVLGPREDKRFDFGANTSVIFTQKLSGSARVQYRTKESTNSTQNYDEFSVYVGLSYGIGNAKGRSNPGRF